MLDQIAMMLGGRVAEEIVFGDITTGASNDIERATKIAKQMVTRFGMSEKLGPQTFGDANHEVFLGATSRPTRTTAPRSPTRSTRRSPADRRGLREGARDILVERRAQLDLMAEVLVERETVDRDELAALLEDRWDEYLAQEAAKPPASEDDVPPTSDGDEAEAWRRQRPAGAAADRAAGLQRVASGRSDRP